jgi:hypothetical protein
LDSTADKRMKPSLNLLGEQGRPASSPVILGGKHVAQTGRERKSFFTLVTDKMKLANRTLAIGAEGPARMETHRL